MWQRLYSRRADRQPSEEWFPGGELLHASAESSLGSDYAFRCRSLRVALITVSLSSVTILMQGKQTKDPMTPIFGTAPIDYVSEEAMPVESGGRVWPGFRSRAPPTGLARRSRRADEEESELYPPSLVAQPLSTNQPSSDR
jgi:hypothetical protein